MRTSRHVFTALLTLAALFAPVVIARAADPGITVPFTSEINDQKAGSVLFFNFYTSNAANPATENTRLALTNTSSTSSAFVRLLFVRGNNGSVNNLTVCLTPKQTVAVLTSDFDPGTRGYLVAAAIDPISGCPVNFNFLTGESYVKLSSGYAANFGAEAVAAIAQFPTTCSNGSTSATLNFDGANYNQLPRALAIDKIRSAGDGNSMLLILNRIGGDLATGAAPQIGAIEGELIDDLAASAPLAFSVSAPQLVTPLSDAFPVTAPVFTAFIPAGRTGWMTLFSPNNVALLGSFINFNPNVAISGSAFKGGHNLRKLTLATPVSLTIPVSPPGC